ncbi:MAG: hypothetical protein KC635_25515, partial [Myxococcales bacterium]|nr:hypothetical protein [Myxococcales bacterium]
MPLVTYRGWEALAGAPPGLAEVQALQRGDLVSAYLADYRRFCRDVGELVGFRAIIHLEPDLAGHAQRAADDPASVPVALAAAGATECAGLGDDFGGLGRCLVRIARAEAPYALIAVHASSWANGPDAFFEVDPQYDPFPSAGRVGAFLAAAGGDEADLVALEMSDRDAAYDGRWWDDRD